MRRPLVLLAAVLSAAPLAARAQEPAAPGPTGLTATFSLGGGGELGLDDGKAGVAELEGTIGYELSGGLLRPELGAALGLAPDSHVALRPGVRFLLPGVPIQLRAALDASTSRVDSGFDWRWILVGVAGELRFTSLLGLFAEIDTGAKLSSRGGLPLLVRAGASFRF